MQFRNSGPRHHLRTEAEKERQIPLGKTAAMFPRSLGIAEMEGKGQCRFCKVTFRKHRIKCADCGFVTCQQCKISNKFIANNNYTQAVGSTNNDHQRLCIKLLDPRAKFGLIKLYLPTNSLMMSMNCPAGGPPLA